MFSWILKMLPADYKWGVAVKNITYDVGKGVAMLLTYGKVKTVVGSHLTPDQIQQVQVAATALTGAFLAWFHDYAQVKWPNATWL